MFVCPYRGSKCNTNAITNTKVEPAYVKNAENKMNTKKEDLEHQTSQFQMAIVNTTKYCTRTQQILYQHSTSLDTVPGSIGHVLHYIEYQHILWILIPCWYCVNFREKERRGGREMTICSFYQAEWRGPKFLVQK